MITVVGMKVVVSVVVIGMKIVVSFVVGIVENTVTGSAVVVDWSAGAVHHDFPYSQWDGNRLKNEHK